MKPFQEQFTECSETGMTGKGEFKLFSENPELLPAFNPNMLELIHKDPKSGLQLLSCKKFGGKCGSKHTQCQQMRSKQKY
jgi:hypothetical protein